MIHLKVEKRKAPRETQKEIKSFEYFLLKIMEWLGKCREITRSIMNVMKGALEASEAFRKSADEGNALTYVELVCI